MRNPMSAVDSDKGFTILELLTVILIISTVFAIAIPSYVTWRQSVEFRTTARAIAAILRDARSRAILSNLQHRVEFETGVAPAPPGPTGRYRMTQGDRAANSSTWGTAVQGWATTPNSVTLNFTNLTVNAGNNSIDFNPSGIAVFSGTNADIQIRDDTGTARFTVQVSNTGRIRVF